jgi:hypothetical protein
MMPVSTLAICTTFAAMAVAMAVGANASAAYQPTLPFRLHDGTLSTVQNNGAGPGAAQRPAGPLNTIAEVFTALEACWIPPALDQARAGMQITVQLSFKRSGELLGKPRITYETPDASDDERLSYRVAMAQALRRCTPLPFTDALGGALAGRPLTIRFIDNRKLKQAGATHDSEC